MAKSKKGRHTSVEKELKRSLAWLEAQATVTKIVFGFTEAARHSFTPGSLRYQMDAPGGIKLKAYGGNGVMDMYVKVAEKDKRALLDKISERWQT